MLILVLALFHGAVLVFVFVAVWVCAFLDGQCRLLVRSLDHDAGEVVAQRLDRTIQPGQQSEAVRHYDVGPADPEEVARREFETVGLGAGPHDGLDFHPVAADAFGEVLHRVDARDHAQWLGGDTGGGVGRLGGAGGSVRRLGLFRAGRYRQGQGRDDEQQKHTSNTSSHSIASIRVYIVRAQGYLRGLCCATASNMSQ